MEIFLLAWLISQHLMSFDLKKGCCGFIIIIIFPFSTFKL